MSDREIVKQKFTDWREYLRGKSSDRIDDNSICDVIYSLFWEMGAYESYIAICKSNPGSPLSTLLFDNLTSYNYIQVQAIRIRRLSEKYSDGSGEKDKSIYSLLRIVDEMKKEHEAGRLTRENICDVYGIPASRREIERQFDEATSGVSGSFSTNSITAGNIHVMLDKIFDKNGSMKAFFKKIDKRLLVDRNAQLGEIIHFVDKNIVHSASESSRKQLGKELALRVMDMKKVIQDLTEVFCCLNMLVTQIDQGVVPLGWQEQLTNLSDSEIETTYGVFENIERDCTMWKHGGYELLGL